MYRRSLTREELYDLVWAQPMRQLASELGISDRGLSKVCKRNAIPTPPKGYWNKLYAGMKTMKIPLPAKPEDKSNTIYISSCSNEKYSPIKKLERDAFVPEGIKIDIPSDLTDIHPKIAAWVKEHQISKKHIDNDIKYGDLSNVWSRTGRIWALSERDIYRFRVTSALFKEIGNYPACFSSFFN